MQKTAGKTMQKINQFSLSTLQAVSYRQHL